MKIVVLTLLLGGCGAVTLEPPEELQVADQVTQAPDAGPVDAGVLEAPASAPEVPAAQVDAGAETTPATCTKLDYAGDVVWQGPCPAP